MKLKLIEAGGITGRKRTAEMDVTEQPVEVHEQIRTILASPNPKNEDKYRDKVNYFIEYDGKASALRSILLTGKLKDVINKLKKELKY